MKTLTIEIPSKEMTEKKITLPYYCKVGKKYLKVIGEKDNESLLLNDFGNSGISFSQQDFRFSSVQEILKHPACTEISPEEFLQVFKERCEIFKGMAL